MIWIVGYLWVVGWLMLLAALRSEAERQGISNDDIKRIAFGLLFWPFVGPMLAIIMIARGFGFVIWDSKRGWVMRWQK